MPLNNYFFLRQELHEKFREVTKTHKVGLCTYYSESERLRLILEILLPKLNKSTVVLDKFLEGNRDDARILSKVKAAFACNNVGEVKVVIHREHFSMILVVSTKLRKQPLS